MEMNNYLRRCVVNNDAELRSVDIDLTSPESPIIVGDFVDIERHSFKPALSPQQPPEPAITTGTQTTRTQ
jgi:hypothetical protein